MSHKYDGNMEVQSLISKMLSCRSTEDVEQKFAMLGYVDDDVVEYVVNRIEKIFVEELGGITTAEKEEIRAKLKLLEEAKKDPVSAPADVVRNIEAEFGAAAKYQTNAHVMMRIAAFKGDKADSLVKAYAEELAQLSNEQYNTAAGFLGVAVRAHDKVFGSGPAPVVKKANPFKP